MDLKVEITGAILVQMTDNRGCHWFIDGDPRKRCGKYPTIGKYLGARLRREHWDMAIQRWGVNNIQNRRMVKQKEPAE
jgi:hypothetical protein